MRSSQIFAIGFWEYQKWYPLEIFEVFSLNFRILMLENEQRNRKIFL